MRSPREKKGIQGKGERDWLWHEEALFLKQILF
jgi:hypothetical protein